MPESSEPNALGLTIAEIRRDLARPETYYEQEYHLRATLGLRLFLAVRGGEGTPAQLDEAITELTRARVLLVAERGRTRRADVLAKLAEARIGRAAQGGPHADADARAFVAFTREALGELAADVLLQAGSDHGLSAALSGAVLARRLAFVAVSAQRPADAVADLEKGRALCFKPLPCPGASPSSSTPQATPSRPGSGAPRPPPTSPGSGRTEFRRPCRPRTHQTHPSGSRHPRPRRIQHRCRSMIRRSPAVCGARR
ncbi:hypothetical protein [Streptomyces flavofungini]|uniref:hypothetical protein n=1 Tax=Streptomyces flavofungini TaxID=68200 RepID=UPI0025B1EE7F|nr:hypothetical protein [Streptomyces flavofungini]WJV50952.1 hypothetical protein QUY26_38905 [Streptomyces flavofungini]